MFTSQGDKVLACLPPSDHWRCWPGCGHKPHRGFAALPGFCLSLTRVPTLISFLCGLLFPLNTDWEIGFGFWMCALPKLKSFSRKNAIWLLAGLLFLNRLVTALPSDSGSPLSLKWLKMVAGARAKELFTSSFLLEVPCSPSTPLQPHGT